MKKQDILASAGKIVKVGGTGNGYADANRVVGLTVGERGKVKKVWRSHSMRRGYGRLTGRSKTVSLRYWPAGDWQPSYRNATVYEVDPLPGDPFSVDTTWSKRAEGEALEGVWVESRYVREIVGSDEDRAEILRGQMDEREARAARQMAQEALVVRFAGVGLAASKSGLEGVQLRLTADEAAMVLQALEGDGPK